MPRRNRTIEEMLARTTVDDLARVPTTNPRVADAQAQLAASRRELVQRGLGPAERIAAETREPAQGGAAHRVGQRIREFPLQEQLERLRQGYVDNFARRLPIFQAEDLTRGVVGAPARQWPDRPHSGQVGTQAPPTVASVAPQTEGATTPAPGEVGTQRQTSFTNEDAEGLADQVMTMPAIEVPQEPTALEQALAAAIERMAPPRQQATLIRHTPERRLTGSPRERREQLRAEALDVAREQVRQAEQTQTQAQRQQAIQEQATLLATMRSQEQALTAQLMQLQAQAVDGTPEGRLAAARAAQIEEALVRIRAARAAGEITLEQEIGFLTGSADTRQPIQDMMGGIAGTFSTTTGRPELFPADVREQLSPNLRR